MQVTHALLGVIGTFGARGMMRGAARQCHIVQGQQREQQRCKELYGYA
jgi:hypothetical protein